MSTAVKEIVSISRRYGDGEDWVIAGGGNTSIKEGNTLWVKASGTTLATITAEQFVAMDRTRLAAIWDHQYPEDADAREVKALEDLMAARIDQSGTLRPSVETLMHALFPHRLVVHTHATLVNGVTCAQDGETTVHRLFGDEALWIPTIDPGYTLARDMYNRVEAWKSTHGGAVPAIVIMQNHGLVVAGESAEEIDRIHARIVQRIREELTREPEMEPAEHDADRLRELGEAVAHALANVRAMAGNALERPVVTTFDNPELRRRSASPETFEPVASAFSPDHIVYSGHKPCYVDLPQDTNSPKVLEAEVLHALHDYCHDEDAAPKIVVIRGRGAVAVTPTERKTDIAYRLFLNTLQVAAYAESFGGSQFMPAEQIAFVRNWEVEKFREKQSTGDS